MNESHTSCPSETRLEQFADGSLDAADIAAHVEQCGACQGLLGNIRENNLFLSDNRRALLRSATGALWESPPIAGYRIVREISRGGQAVVYEAVQESTQQPVAIKMFREGRFSGAGEHARFDREVRALAELDHPNIVPIHDSGATSSFYYLVMKYIDGCPLDQTTDFGLSRRGEESADRAGESPRHPRARIERLLRLFLKICGAVSAAHLRGIVHRDLKPGNIMVNSAGEPFVLDFGLAKLTEAAGANASLTRTGRFMGSLPWASPEQTEGLSEAIDLRSDVYSLGVVLYQMLTGGFPYPVTGSMRTVLDHIARTAPRRPNSARKELNGELDTILLKALEKDKRRRYQSVEALRADVERYLAGEALEAKRDSTWYVLRKTARRHKLPLGVAAAFVALIGGFAIDRSRRAARLESALHDANIGRGRVEVRQGNTTLAEKLLWREYLAAAPATDGRSPAFWALWELYAAQPGFETWRGFNNATRLRFDAGGTVLFGCDDSAARAWSIAPNGASDLITELPFDGLSNLAADLAPSGEWAAIGAAEGRIRVFRLPSKRVESTWQAHANGVAWLGFVDNETIVSVGAEDRAARVWSRTEGKLISETVFKEAPSALAIERRNAVLSVTLLEARRIRMFDVDTLTERNSIDLEPIISAAQSVRLSRATFSPSGDRIAVLCYDAVGVWDCTTGELLQTLLHEWTVNTIAFCRDESRLAAAGKPGIQFWDLETGQPEATYAGNRSPVSSIVFGAGDVLAAADETGNIRLWESRPFAGLRIKDTAPLHAITFSPDGETIACGGESTGDAPNIWIVEAETGEVRRELRAPGDIAACIAFDHDGSRLAAGSYEDGRVRVWELRTETALDLDTQMDGVSSLAFSPVANSLAACSNSVGSVRVLDCGAGDVLWRIDDLPARIPSVVFSADGALCAASDHRGGLSVFDGRSGARLAAMTAHQGAARVVRFSPDGRRIASGGDDGLIHVWDSRSGRRNATLAGHRDNVYGTTFTPDGHLLASGGQDGFVRLWNVDDGRLLATLPGDGGVIASVSVSPDGDTLAFGTFAGHLGIWDLDYYDRHIYGNRAYQESRDPAE